MHDPMRPYRTLACKLYTARRLFLKPPGLLQRLRLYREFRHFSAAWDATEDFDLKVRDVCASPDNARIPRVPEAGQILDGQLVMHNGLRVIPGSYAGEGMTRVLQRNRGVHEPQEELAFRQVLEWLQEKKSPAPTMVELGAYWAFYSLWFHSVLPGARCVCVEPEQENLEFGQRNFELNGFKAEFLRAFVGERAAEGTPPTVSVDSLLRERAIERVDILHADIQQYEFEMLHGARESFARQAVDYLFISTHHNFLHYRCIDELEAAGFVILAEADLIETYSTDGLIVAGRRGLPRLERIPITPRRI